MTADEQPPRYRDYLRGPTRSELVPERVPDPRHRSTVYIVLDDEPAVAEQLAKDGREWDGPPPAARWCASDQGESGVLAEFEGTREEAVAWALARPDVERILVYSERTRDLEPLERPEP